MIAEDCIRKDPARRTNARKALRLSPLFLVAIWLAYLPWWPVQLEAASRRLSIAPVTHFSWTRVGRILAFFFFAPDGSYPLRFADWILLTLVLIGSVGALLRDGVRFLPVWGLVGLAVIEVLWRLHPHWDVARIYLPAGIALSALAALPIAAVFRSRAKVIGGALVIAILFFDAKALSVYFREGRADWRPVAKFLRSRPIEERLFTENQYSQLCVAFYVVGPAWAFQQGTSGRQIPNLDGEVERLTYSWTPNQTAWLVAAGEPAHPELRAWARQFPAVEFPTAEEAVLYRLDPALRTRAFDRLPVTTRSP